MPKVKTNRAAKKRFRKTGGKTIKHACAFRRHLLTHKPRNRKRRLRKGAVVSHANLAHVKLLLPV